MRKPTAKQLTLTIEGQYITSDRFLKAVSSFIALINEVAEQVTQERSPFKWIVSVESGSARLHFRPEPNRATARQMAASMLAIDTGIKTIQQRPQRPRYWSDTALRKAKDLAETIDITTDASQSVSVEANGEAHYVTRRTIANVDVLIGSEYKSLGTIEGRLRTVTEAGGALHFVVQDAVTLNNVRCYFTEEQADECIKAFRRRVAVYGEIRYRKDGEPVSITVHELRILREQHELPKASEVKGILA